MTLYRKRPVVVEARQFTGTPDNDLAAWCGGSFFFFSAPFGQKHAPVIEIDTLEGTMTASPGDWIVKGVQGEFYPVKDSIFRETYEPAGGTP